MERSGAASEGCKDAVVPHVAAILNSTRKEIAMSDKEKVALTKLTSKGG